MSFRSRLIASLLLAVLVGAGSLALERGLGLPAPGSEPAPPDVSGAWFCPHGGGEGWRVWVVVANPAAADAFLRVTTYGIARPRASTDILAPGEVRYLEVPANTLASGTVVEYLGTSVAAGMVLARPQARGVAAEPCSADAGRSWFVAEGTSLRGQGARLVVMNPFDVDAVFDVVLNAKGRILQPGPLTGVVLPPRRARAFDLNRFALGEERLAASVRVSLGKVAASGLGLSVGGLRATLAAPAPSRTWILPAPPGDGRGSLAVLVPGTRRAPFRARAQGAGGQRPLLEEATVGPGGSRSFDVPEGTEGLVVEAEGRGPFVAARRLVSADGGDLASTGGAPWGANRWVALPASGPGGGTSVLLLHNPGSEPAVGRLSFLTETGRAEAPELASVTVPPGRVSAIDLTTLVGERPVAALVEVDRGTLVAAQASHGRGGYAVAVGVPLRVFWPR